MSTPSARAASAKARKDAISVPPVFGSSPTKAPKVVIRKDGRPAAAAMAASIDVVVVFPFVPVTAIVGSRVKVAPCAAAVASLAAPAGA